MKKNFSRVASLMLAVMMLISLLPANVLASAGTSDTVTLTGTISFPGDAYLDGELTVDIYAYGQDTRTQRYWQDWADDLKDIPFEIEFPADESRVSVSVRVSNTYKTQTNIYTSNYGAGNFTLTSEGMKLNEDPYSSANGFSFEEIAAADIVIPTGKEVSGKITGENLQVVDGEFVGLIFGDYFTRAYIDAETHEYKTVLPYGITAGEYTPYLDKSEESTASNILTGQYKNYTVQVDPEKDIKNVDFTVDTGCAVSGKIQFPENAGFEYYNFDPMLNFGKRKYYINTAFTGTSYDHIPYMIGIAESELPVSDIFHLEFFGYAEEVDGCYSSSNIEEGDYYYSSASSNGTVRDKSLATELTITKDTEGIDFHLDMGAMFALWPTMQEGACSSSFYYSFEVISADGLESFSIYDRFDIQDEENYVSVVLPKDFINKEVYYIYQVDGDTVSNDSTLYTGEVYLCPDGSMVETKEEAETFTIKDWNEVFFDFIEDDYITPPVTPDVPSEYDIHFNIVDKHTREDIPYASLVIATPSSASATRVQANGAGWAAAKLFEGTYTVQTSADGYVTKDENLEVVMDGQTVLIELEKIEIDIADNTTFTVRDGDTENTPVIAGASLTLEDENGKKYTLKTDASGKATADLADGTYSVAAIADGYKARSFKIERSNTNNNFTVYLNREDIIKVTSTVKELTKAEAQAAGIDTEALGNKQVYNQTAVLSFMPSVPISYYYTEGGEVVKGETVVHDNIAVTPVARDIFLIVKSSTAWLKEIFEVQIVCANSSAAETVKNLTANMTIPDGLSLAIMAEGEQSENVVLGDVAPKANAEHRWYICGDKAGEYTLSGTLTGTREGGGISEDIKLNFGIEKPITVLAGKAMQLTIEAEKYAVVDKPYRMRYTLENVSEKTLYDLSFTVLGGKFFEDYGVVEAKYAREFGPEAIEDLDGEGFLFETEEFKPGEKVSGVFTITFGEGLDLSEGQGWRLTDAFVVTGAGSTTEIPTNFKWHDVLPVHDWNDGEVTKNPTCTTDGERIYTCLDTNCDIKTKTEIIPATGHNMGEFVTTDPTCTTEGAKTSKCQNDGCDHSVTLPLAALGHDWKTEKEEDKAPTCTEAGSKSIHCTRCTETKDAEEIPVLGHDMGGWTTTVEPGCESTGTERRECSRGDYFEENTLPATDHKWDEGKVTTPPTVDAEGEKTFTCENGCGKTKTEKIDPLLPQEIEFEVPTETYTCKYGVFTAIDNKATNSSQDGGVLSYTSSDESVATVDEKGRVTIVSAGETTITATAAATEKYIETSASYRLVVEKAALTVKPKTVEIFYGGEAAFSEVEGEGFVLGEDVNVLTGDAVFKTDYKAFDKAGEYAVTVSGITAKNYEITFAPGVLNVKKAEKYEIVLSMLSYRKGDKIEVKAEIIPKDETAAIKLEYSADGKEWTDTAPTEIGTYKVRASLVKSDNLAVSETPVYTEAELEIKAGAMISVGGEEFGIGMETKPEKGTVEFTATEETVEEVIKNVPSTGEVVIDASGGGTKGFDTLVLPENIVKALDESDNVDTFTVIADDAEITMDADVLSTAAKEMEENSTLSVKITKVDEKELNPKQQAALNAISGEAHVIQLNLVVTNYDENKKPISEDIHELRGSVDIKARYELPDDMDGKRVVVCYVSDNGTVTYKRAEYKDGFVHFTTDHFSHYAIMAIECPHDWNDGVVITPATTTSEGLMRYTCLLCDTTKDEAIPKKSVTSGNGGGLTAGGDKSNTGADKLGNEDEKKDNEAGSTDTPVVSAPKFVDIGAHAWAADAINALAEAGIIKGTAADKFSPAANITRADFAILLVRAFDLTSDNGENFADVSANDYFASELATARNTGIVGGIGGNKFAPRNAITRQDMMTIVYRALQNAKVEGIISPEMTDEVALSKTYTDFTLVSDYAKDAVSVLSHMHFVNGKNGRLAPNDYTTRAEVAVLLQRILEYVK